MWQFCCKKCWLFWLSPSEDQDTTITYSHYMFHVIYQVCPHLDLSCLWILLCVELLRKQVHVTFISNKTEGYYSNIIRKWYTHHAKINLHVPLCEYIELHHANISLLLLAKLRLDTGIFFISASYAKLGMTSWILLNRILRDCVDPRWRFYSRMKPT